jgi:hypothetical protein
MVAERSTFPNGAAPGSGAQADVTAKYQLAWCSTAALHQLNGIEDLALRYTTVRSEYPFEFFFTVRRASR